MVPVRGARSPWWLVPALVVLAFGATSLPRAAAADEEIAGFLGAFCAAIDRNDEEFVGQHLHLPLQLRVIVDENAGQPRTASQRLRTVRAVLGAHLCDGIDFATARFEQVKKAWRIVADIGQSDVELEVAPRKGRLILLSYRHPAPHAAPHSPTARR